MRLSASVLGAALSAMLMGGCAKPYWRAADRDFPHWEKAIKLFVTAPPVLDASKPASLGLRLGNQGVRAIDACIGVRREMWIFPDLRVPVPGRSVVAATLDHVVDHEFCDRPFNLAPGAEVAWTEDLVVPNAVPGPAQMVMILHIVHPRACGQYGCSTLRLSTSIRTEVR